MNRDPSSEVRLKRSRRPWQLEEDLKGWRLLQGKARRMVVMSQFGVEAVGRHKNMMPLGEGRSESGVANWTGVQSTKTVRGHLTMPDREQKSQAWD